MRSRKNRVRQKDFCGGPRLAGRPPFRAAPRPFLHLATSATKSHSSGLPCGVLRHPAASGDLRAARRVAWSVPVASAASRAGWTSLRPLFVVPQPLRVITVKPGCTAMPSRRLALWLIHQSPVLVDRDYIREGRDGLDLLPGPGKRCPHQRRGRLIGRALPIKNLDIGPKGPLRNLLRAGSSGQYQPCRLLWRP